MANNNRKLVIDRMIYLTIKGVGAGAKKFYLFYIVTPVSVFRGGITRLMATDKLEQGAQYMSRVAGDAGEMQGGIFFTPVGMQAEKKPFQGADQNNQVIILSGIMMIELDGHGNSPQDFAALKPEYCQKKTNHDQSWSKLSTESWPVDPLVEEFNPLGDDGGAEKHSKAGSCTAILHLQDRTLDNPDFPVVLELEQKA